MVIGLQPVSRGIIKQRFKLFRILFGLDQGTVIVLDALRKQRNVNDYEGDPISDQAVGECIKQAEQLHRLVSAWVATNRPDLF